MSNRAASASCVVFVRSRYSARLRYPITVRTGFCFFVLTEETIVTFRHHCKQYLVTLCNLLSLLVFTGCHDYTLGVRPADVVLEKLRGAGVRPAVLAKALGVGRSAASLMLAGKRGIPSWRFPAVAKLLNQTVPALVTPVEKKAESPTPADIDPGVQGKVRVRKAYADVPRGPFDAKADPVRSPLAIAVLLEEQAADFSERADIFRQLSEELQRSLAGTTRPPAHTKTPLDAHPPEARRRSPRRRRGGER